MSSSKHMFFYFLHIQLIKSKNSSIKIYFWLKIAATVTLSLWTIKTGLKTEKENTKKRTW